MNRAISGDSVVVQILPKEEWKRSSLRAIEEGIQMNTLFQKYSQKPLINFNFNSFRCSQSRRST